jgi:hypothetical protein
MPEQEQRIPQLSTNLNVSFTGKGLLIDEERRPPSIYLKQQ